MKRLAFAEFENEGGEDKASNGESSEQDGGGGHVEGEEVDGDGSETKGCEERDGEDDEEHCVSFVLVLLGFFLV